MKKIEHGFNPTAMALAIVFVWLVRALLILGFWCLLVLALLGYITGVFP